MSSVPWPELPPLSGSSPGVEPATAGDPQHTETNSQFSTVLEGEQATLDTGQRGPVQERSANDDVESLPERPIAVATEEEHGNVLPRIGGLEGIVFAGPVAESAVPPSEQEGGIFKAQAAVLPSSDVGATLNRIMSTTSSEPQARPDLTGHLVQTGVTGPAVPVAEAAVIATKHTNNLSAAVHRALQSDMLPVQVSSQATPASESPAASLMTAQFVAVQVLGDGSSTPATMLANAAASSVANTGGSAVATASGLPATTLDVPFRQTGWDGALGERVVWMVSQKLQAAEIKLNPPQLGPVEVRINVHNDQAQVTFTAQHANVREALEAAIPRLKDMFGSTGLDLIDVGVSQQSYGQHEGSGSRNTSVGAGSAVNNLLALEDSSAPVTRHVDRLPGVIDLFA